MFYELETLEFERELAAPAGGAGLLTPGEVLSFYQTLLVEGTAAGFVECGNAFRSFEMIDEAFEAYGAAIVKDPNCLGAYLGRGELYFEHAILGRTSDEVQRYALLAGADFRQGTMVSPDSSELVWRFGTTLLIGGDTLEAWKLAENVLGRSNVINDAVRRDFVYLLGLAQLFSGDSVRAGVAAEELARMEGDAGEGEFLRLVISIVYGEVEAASDFKGCALGDSGLIEAGERLRVSGCREFLDVARALVAVKLERRV